MEPESPEWWVQRLYRKLRARRSNVGSGWRKVLGIDDLIAYYEGTPPNLPWLPEQAQDEFYRLLALTKSNYMGLVVDATAERLQIEGFRIGDSAEADAQTWAIWQANRMDADSDKAILDALITGYSYLLVAPNPADVSKPLIYVEHPSQAIVDYVPGTARRERAAGLKVWEDDISNLLMATLYLPGTVYKYQARIPQSGAGIEPRWERRAVAGEQWPADNPLKVVPLVELENNPRTLRGGVSEIADVTSVQDRICKTLADRLMTQDFGAFPQKWATGYPDKDGDGNATPRIDVGRDRMVSTDVAETKFGQWDAADLDGYIKAKQEDVKDIASRTRTPAQYLLGEMSNVNGETLKASESGLVSKTRQRARSLGEDIEDAIRLVRQVAGIGAPGETIETIWRNPEFRTEGELVDALTKMATLGVPQEALWERWGASQVEIARWRAMADEQAARDPLTEIARNAASVGA